VTYDAVAARRKPDPDSIDWSQPETIPRKPNGMRWSQLEFPEMLGEGAQQCGSRTCLERLYLCLLRTGHDGLHEALTGSCGVVSWSDSFAYTGLRLVDGTD
jgi:hypothetical protein